MVGNQCNKGAQSCGCFTRGRESGTRKKKKQKIEGKKTEDGDWKNINVIGQSGTLMLQFALKGLGAGGWLGSVLFIFFSEKVLRLPCDHGWLGAGLKQSGDEGKRWTGGWLNG